MLHTNLEPYGWNDGYHAALAALEPTDHEPARVIAEYGMNYRVSAPDELTCEITGKVLHDLPPTERPKVGDWVLIERIDSTRGLIHSVLPRTSEIARLQSDRTRTTRRRDKQVLAVNVNIAFLVQSLDQDFSPKRLERYLFALGKGGIKATVVLNKSDMNPQGIQAALAELTSLGLPVLVVSAKTGSGMEQVKQAIIPGQTAVFLGSSGVGKSTMTNYLLGQSRQITQAVRESDSKGRHTTSHRELFMLPDGGLLIDTPGLRELQLWGSDRTAEEVFADIEAIAGDCQFQDCAHQTEPGCAVVAAVSAGTLPAARLVSYHELQAELRSQNQFKDAA